MIDNILSFWAPGQFELIVILIVIGIPIVLIIVFLKLLLRNKNENIKLRLEVAKLADELEKVRRKGNEGKVSSEKSD